MILLSNENFPRHAVLHLRELGYTVYSIQEESPGISDSEVMSLAREMGAVILTFDRDYGELIYLRGVPPPLGVIYFRFIPNHPLEPATLLAEYLKLKDIQLESNFSILHRDRLRQRKLPR